MRLGIIIPFRKREEHLKISAPVLSRIGHVYVVEQMDGKPFNRAKLINAGYNEFKKEFDYFAAHDVDMIPESVNGYAHSDMPCHIATEVDQFGWNMPYPDYFGGVTLFPNNRFEQVNGFSNEYWSWGGEDDELRKRFLELGIPIQRRQCRFTSLLHARDFDKELRMKNVARLRAPIDWEDGLTNCKYEITHCEDFENYTLLQVML